MWAVVGGSGFEKFEEFKTVEEVDRNTPFGQASSGIKKVRVGKHEFLFVSRHGSQHELLPSEVNYRANIYALKREGATRLVSFSAVGSLQKELAPGDLVIPKQFIDRTKSVRQVTFCGSGLVGHVSLAQPVWKTGVEALRQLKDKMDFKIHFDRTYICVEGPYFSTQAESHSFRSMGAEIIGMTAFPEYALVREAGMSYLPCFFVTDYDCWDDSIEHVTLATVLELMKKNNGKAFSLLKAILELDPASDRSDRDGGLKFGLLTPPSQYSPEQKDFLQVLQS